jgi:hypothetical protein
MRRHLPLFVAIGSEAKDPVGVSNCAPGCFFLSDDGLCEIQVKHGYAAKPETCRLFPFNQLRRYGKYLMVRPHSSLCPLQVVRGPSLSDSSEHLALLDAMSLHEISAAIPRVVLAVSHTQDVIPFERHVATLSEQFLDGDGYLPFVRSQLEALEAQRYTSDQSDAEIQNVTAIAADLLDCPVESELGLDPDLVRTMIAATPYLRSELIFNDDVPDNAAATRPHVPLDFAKVPLALLCIYLFAETARRAGMKRVTFQSIVKIAHELRALAELLPITSSVIAWRDGLPIEMAGFQDRELRAAFYRIAKALLPSVQKKRRATLGDILREHAPVDRSTRAPFFRQVAKQMAGRVAPLGDEPLLTGRVRTRERVASTLQRAALATGDEQFLEIVYRRLRSRTLHGRAT